MNKVAIVVLLLIVTCITQNTITSEIDLNSPDENVLERGGRGGRGRGGKGRGGGNSRGGNNSSGSALIGFILGPILFISAFPCIWYNERRAAIEYRRIKLGK